jgi:hypothetical protein
MAIQEETMLTPRESIILEHDTEEQRLAREHAVRMKQLELELAREKHAADIELKKLEAKWSSWLRIPITIVKLPIYLILSFGYLLDSIRGNEPSRDYWKLLN